MELNALLYEFDWGPQSNLKRTALDPAMPQRPDVEADSLASLWEADFTIRDRLRIYTDDDGRQAGGKLLSWPDPKNKVVSMQSIASNVRILTLLAEHWCPNQKKPKCPNIKFLKREAGRQKIYPEIWSKL